MKDIHELITEARKAAKLSQQDMADKMGMTRLAYGRMERGEAANLNTLRKAAEVLGMKIEFKLVRR